MIKAYLFLNSIANSGFNLFLSGCCLIKKAVTIPDPPRILLAISIIAVSLKASAIVTPVVPIAKAGSSHEWSFPHGFGNFG